MPDRHVRRNRKRGITVLGLLLLIIALVIAAVFLIRYLRNRPTNTSLAPPIHGINRLIS